MGTISSGIGLISGLDTQSLVDRLLALDARPRELLRQRVGTIDAQKTAYLDVSARITAMLARINVLASRSSFLTATATSSQPATLTASASDAATPGSYTFLVRALATTQQTISRGFASSSAPLPPGTVSIESARARVNGRTRLDELNGHAGVQRGSFRIRDASGNEKTISIQDATTLREVVERINAAGNNVRASVRNDAIVLTETTGGALRVLEVDDGRTAASLGFGEGRTYSATGRLEGSNVMVLSGLTPLSALNDGNGVSIARAGSDFSINGVAIDASNQMQPSTRIERLNHGGGVTLGTIRVTTQTADNQTVTTEIDLSGLRTVGEIESLIEESVPGIAITLTAGRLIVGYSGGVTNRTLSIEDVSGSAARDLGIAGSAASGRITGRDVLFNTTVADVLAAINFASGNDGTIQASISGGRLVINAGASVTLDETPGSTTLRDLGFVKDTFVGAVTGRRVLGGVDTTLLSSLDGGRGIAANEVRLGVGGASVLVSLRGAETLQEAVDRLNDAARGADLDVEIGYDATGTRLVAASPSGQVVSLTDTDGEFAARTGLTQSGTTLRGSNLQRRYIAEATPLGQLNHGRGISSGRIRLTNSQGVSATIDLSGNVARNVGDLLQMVSDLNIGITARVNRTGDGIELIDTTSGSGSLRVVDETGNAARDLNIAGESSTRQIDGSYEVQIDITAGMSLSDLAARINSRAGAAASASILNDGSAIAPYRLQLTAKASGLAGEMIVDGGPGGLDFATLVRAQDAQVVLGGNGTSGLVLTSSSNTLSNVVPGLTLTLGAPSDAPVTVTVTRSIGAARDALKGLVDAYNAAIDRVRQLGDFDPATERRGVLLGESTLRTVESRLARVATGAIPGASGAITRLSQVGVRLSNGKLIFDETKFNEAYERDPQGVTEFFTKSDVGAAAVLKKNIEAITKPDGVITQRTDTLTSQARDLNERIVQLGVLLEGKRARLLRQFQAMESALAQLQSQQAALGQLASISLARPSRT